ncbi:hypothetical protein BDV12DRAFT_204031 [Aspergillus spectabilis]
MSESYPLVYIIRQAATQFNQYMTTAHEKLQDYSIADALSMDQMIFDLDVHNRNEAFIDGILSTFVGLATIRGVVSGKGSTGDADGLGVIGGAMVIYRVKATSGKKMEAWFKNYFWNVRENLKNITNRMFGGDQVDSDNDVLDPLLDQLHALGMPDDGWNSKISKVLSTGAFLQSVGDSDITDAIEACFQQMRKRLIGTLFTASNVVSNKARMEDGDEYCSGYGNCYIDSHYYMLYFPDNGHMKPVDADVLNKLEYTYGVDPAALYLNATPATTASRTAGVTGWN